jgi:hypothetical protein
MKILKEEVMKKNLLILVILLLTFGLTTGFSQELTATVGGSGSVTFGFNLNDNSMGFANAFTSSIDLTLIPSATSEDDPMEEGLYGYIKLADYTITIDEDTPLTVTEPAITAKLMMDPIYIQIYNQDGLATGQVTPVEDAGAGVEDAETGIASDLTNYGGIIIGGTFDPITLKLFLASGTGYAFGDGNSAWALGADVTLAVSPITVTGEFVQSINQDDNETGIGAKVALAVAPLSPYVAFDAKNTGTGGFVFEVGAGTGFDFGNSSNVALAASYSQTNNFDAEVTLTEDATAGFVPNLGLSLVFGIYDIGGAAIDWRVSASPSYTIPDTAKIYATAGFDSASNIPLTVGVDLLMVTNTTFTLKFVSTGLTDTSANAHGAAQDKGVITFNTTITY